MRFAICDDISIFLKQLSKMIYKYSPNKNEVIEIDCFSSGEELLECYRPNCYDAVILDVEMKEIDGLRTAYEIRRQDKNVVIAFHTSRCELTVDGIGCYIHMVKGQSAELYKSQFEEIFRRCISKC